MMPQPQGGPGVNQQQGQPGMRMPVSQHQQQMMMMQQQQQQSQAQRGGMLRAAMSQGGPQGGGVSQLQQRLTANRMSQPNQMMGGPGQGMQNQQRMPMSGNMNMMQTRMGHMGPGNMQSGMGVQGMMGPMNRGPPPMYQNPHMVPGGSPNVTMMSHSPVGGQYIHSPASQAGIPSPAGQRGTVPSPLSSANTPLNEAPGSQEDQQYLEKVRQLSKYIEPLQRMIARMGNEDQRKLEKMEKLLDILSNPNKRMPIDTLKKCETVLKRMNFDVSETATDTTTTTTTTTTAINPFLEAIVNIKKTSGSYAKLNHSLQKTLGTPLDALYGSEMTIPDLTAKKKLQEVEEYDGEDEDEVPVILQAEVARLKSHFKVSLDSSQPTGMSMNSCITLVCQLDDPHLPAVPPITVDVPSGYPDVSPTLSDPDLTDYLATPFLERVQEAFSSRLAKMSQRFTLTQLLNTWEMALRAACSPYNNYPVVSADIVEMAT